MTEAALARIYLDQFRPLILYLYGEALLVLPSNFDPAVEGPRLVAALRAQGMSTRFKTVNGKEVK